MQGVYLGLHVCVNQIRPCFKIGGMLAYPWNSNILKGQETLFAIKETYDQTEVAYFIEDTHSTKGWSRCELSGLSSLVFLRGFEINTWKLRGHAHDNFRFNLVLAMGRIWCNPAPPPPSLHVVFIVNITYVQEENSLYGNHFILCI